MSKKQLVLPVADEPRPQFDFLMSILVLMASLGLALFLLWAASQIAGLPTFNQLPLWLKGGFGKLFTALTTGSSLLGILIKSKNEQNGPNYLLWILGIALSFCLVIVGLSTILKPKQNPIPTSIVEPGPKARPSPTPPWTHQYLPMGGGFMAFDETQKMVVSKHPDAPTTIAENFYINVDVPEAGTYNIEAEWASAEQTEIWVYTKHLPTCPLTSTVGAEYSVLPLVTDGWGPNRLLQIPQTLSPLTLPEGPTTITFASLPCGGGRAGGRAPSTAWIRLTEIPKTHHGD